MIPLKEFYNNQYHGLIPISIMVKFQIDNDYLNNSSYNKVLKTPNIMMIKYLMK